MLITDLVATDADNAYRVKANGCSVPCSRPNLPSRAVVFFVSASAALPPVGRGAPPLTGLENLLPTARRDFVFEFPLSNSLSARGT